MKIDIVYTTKSKYIKCVADEISDGPSHKKGEEAVAGWI